MSSIQRKPPSMTMMPSSSDEASTILSASAESSRAGKSLMARCRLLQLSMVQPHTGYCQLSVVVVEWLAGLQLSEYRPRLHSNVFIMLWANLREPNTNQCSDNQ